MNNNEFIMNKNKITFILITSILFSCTCGAVELNK